MRNRSQINGLILLFATTLLAACGGGGSGSAPTETPVFGTSSNYVQKFNTYLPLTDNSFIYYKDSTLGFEIPDATKINFEKIDGDVDIYTLTIPLGDNDLTLHVSSTPEQILLHKIDGPIEADGFSVDTISFKTPIQFYPAINETVQATATISGIAVGVTVNYTSSNTSLVFDEDYGKLPTLQINLVTTVSSTTFGISETFTTTLELAKGIGVVRNQGTYASTSIAYNINRLTNLPQTIWFDNLSGVPVLASGSDDQFRINGVIIKPSLYDLLNEDEINDLGNVNTIKEIRRKKQILCETRA